MFTLRKDVADQSGRARLLLGGRVGVQVWALPLADCLRATLMICSTPISGPIVLLSAAILGTSREGDSLAWALALVADGVPGFYVLRAD